jgi:hydroxymethylbilane synthase
MAAAQIPGRREVTRAPERIVIASRRSRLAVWQSEYVATELRRVFPHCQVSILGITTRGDQILDRPLAEIGGKGLFVKELEAALEDGRADIAVHSAKDVPMQLPQGFCLAAIPQREDPRDCLVSNASATLEALPAGSFVGTSSLRREAQLRERHPALRVKPLRGNLDTRLSKLDRGEFRAIVLAAAGLKRLGLASRIRSMLEPEQSLPAPGQGALALECREDRAELRAQLASSLDDPVTAACVRAERALSRALSGSCQLPLAAYAVANGGQLRLRGLVASPDGGKVVRAESSGPMSAPEELGESLAARLRSLGADAILASLS